MATSVWSGHLTFGLVSMPVRLYSAARGETISFNLLHGKDHSRIRQVIYCQAEDQPVPRNELVKGYEYEKDQYVVMEEEEIKKVAPRSAKVMEILEFVKASDVDPVYLESSYYMAPDENGRKPYALLFEALKQTGFYGIAKVTMHNREHIVVLRPNGKGIMLHTMYYSNEIRNVAEFHTDTSVVKEKELDLAKMLIHSLEADFEPEKYKDTYRENLQALIAAKLQGREVVEAAAPKMAPVIDIMEALKKSLAERKPAKTATASTQETAEEAEAVPARKRSGGKRRAAG
jgi:DNA end-binding protein Ku